MFRFSRFASATLAAFLLLAAGATAEQAARFGGSVYSGAPDLPLTLSMIEAGGGPQHFKTTTLVGVLAGKNAHAEVAKLTKQYGAANVKEYLAVFDFVVNDAMKRATEAGVKFPATPSPDPKDGAALTAALYKAGVDPKIGFNVEYMLDHLVSHPIHDQVMDDIDAKYGKTEDGVYHSVTLVVFGDLKKAYNL